MKNKDIFYYLLAFVLCVFPFFVGGYYVFYCCAASIILICGTLIKTIKTKKIAISYSIMSIALFLIGTMYLLTKFWAVDKTMAFEGFVKFLAPISFLIATTQLDKEDKQSLLDVIPFSASAMTLIAAIFGSFEKFKLVFHDNAGDLHGAFEYANAYAIYLLIAIIICLLRKHENIKQRILFYIFAVINIFGITQTGSRAVQAISIGMLGLITFGFILGKTKTKKAKTAIICIVVVLGIAAIGAAGYLGYINKIWNYISTDGPMVERSLYYEDCLKYTLRHPFGKGAYAFYFAQPQFQSSDYYVIDVHNDYLQLGIEVGIIPTLLLIGAVIWQLISKETSYMQKAVLLALMAHSMIDYDLQFTSFWFVIILCSSTNKTKEFAIKSNLVASIIAVVLIMINAIIGLSNFYNYMGDHVKSVYYYKNTPSMIVLMLGTTEQQAGYDYATAILKNNDSIFEANQTISRIYQANNDYDKAIEQMEIVLEKCPRKMKRYQNYIDLLVEAEEYYTKNNEPEKANQCIKKITSVPGRIKEIEKNTAPRAKKYGRTQNYNVGKEYKKIIKSYSEK